MTDIELAALLPDGPLKRYVDYWRPTTDAPLIYLVAGAFVTVATLLRNRVYLPFGGDALYPNLWVLLLGPSSFFRKTTCINKSRQIITAIQPELVLPEEFSREALVRHLSAQPSGLLTASEFGGLLASFNRDYMAVTKEMLADLYDSPPTYSRLVGKEHLELIQPCLSLFAASQTNWFLEKVKEIDLQSGFLARVIYIPAHEKPTTIPIPPDPDPDVRAELEELLRNLQMAEGRIELAPGVENTYARWLIQHERDLSLLGDEHVGRLSPFWTRLTTIALKLGMILQVSTDGGLVMTLDTLDRAIQLTEVLKGHLTQLFLSEFTFTKDMANRKKILRLVEKHGAVGIGGRELLRASSLFKIDLDRVMETLIAEGSIVESQNQQRKHYTAIQDCQLPSAA